MKVRPSVRKFHSSEYLNALASGEICLVLGFSGDIKQAQKRAAEAKQGIEIGYVIPKEGAQLWFDNLVIPKDAGNVVEAHELINFLMQPGDRREEQQLHLLCQWQQGKPSLHRQGDPGRQDHLSRCRHHADPVHDQRA